MNLPLQEINADNWEECVPLSVSEHQKEMIFIDIGGKK
jgi:diamine N-acetyltransferase